MSAACRGPSPMTLTVSGRRRPHLMVPPGVTSAIYSIRRPEMARAMTNCWISLVPSKIVWFKLSEFSRSVSWCSVPLNRNDASARIAS